MTENNWKEEEEKIKQAFGDKTWAKIKSEESWRIFKIMSEFVEGIDNYQRLGHAFLFLDQLEPALITPIIR